MAGWLAACRGFDWAPADGPALALAVAGLALCAGAHAVTVGACVRAVDDVLAGARPSAGVALGAAWRNVAALVGVGLAGPWLARPASLLPAAAVLEDQPLGDAVRQLRELAAAGRTAPLAGVPVPARLGLAWAVAALAATGVAWLAMARWPGERGAWIGLAAAGAWLAVAAAVLAFVRGAWSACAWRWLRAPGAGLPGLEAAPAPLRAALVA